MSLRRVITVPERGSTTIPNEVWGPLSGSDGFWNLVEAGFVDVVSRRDGGATLRASMFVGTAICGDFKVEIVEKIPGALAGLMAMSDQGIRPFSAPSGVSSQPDLIGNVVGAFLDRLAEYLSVGIGWTYSTRREVASLVTGRIRLRETLALRARGTRHLVAFERHLIDHSTEVNRMLAVVLREVEQLHTLALVDDSQLARARSAATLLSGCVDAEVLLAPRSTWRVRAEEIAARTVGVVHDLASFAAALLEHSSIDHLSPTLGDVPSTWFVNLESLFERVVRDQLQLATGSSAEVGKAGAGLFVFPKTRALAVDPDLVITQPNSGVIVGDVKYKQWRRAAAASDLYQLLAHAATYGSDECFLVFPSDRFDAVNLGVSSSGVRTTLYSVDARNVATSMVGVAEGVGLPVELPVEEV